jgi:hypothetical protein
MKTKSLRRGAAAAVGLALLGAAFTLRAIQRPGHLHEQARSLYHALRTAGQSPRAYADERPSQRAAAPLPIYEDALSSGWQDWSWAGHDLASQLHVHGGKFALSMTPEAWKGIFLHHDVFSVSGYGTLEVFVRGTSALNVSLVKPDGKFGPNAPLAPYCHAAANAQTDWTVARIPLTDLGIDGIGGNITGVCFQAASDTRQPDIFLDDISLQPDASLPPVSAPATIPVTVNAAANRHPISPYIYGMAYASPDYLADLRLGLNRWGGDDKSRYNWVHGNACNAARDWYWANRRATVDNIPSGPSSAADHFVSRNRSAGAATLLTVPTMGWVARDTDNENRSQNVPEGGNALLPATDGAILGYDPASNRQRTSVRSLARKGAPFTETPSLAGGVVYQDEWIHHLVKRFGTAAAGGVNFYAMDNEPDLWDSTHTDVHPARPGYDDLLAQFLEYAPAVKAVDPTAQITGPVSWGWTGYLYSALDRGDDNFRTHADHMRHGGEPFLLWFLKQVRAHDLRTGKRTLDVLDVHHYPQGDGLHAGSLDHDAQARRLRATRALWDPTYVDESWIHEPVRLLPRLREWIATGYPGTKIGISEWNMGADGDINGALAIADVLGIYGREDVYFANYWMFPPKGSAGYLAFKLYRNADSRSHGFGDLSCRATSANTAQVSCFAALDGPTGDLTLLLVNKMFQTPANVPIQITDWQASREAVRIWRLAAAASKAILAEAGPVVRDGSLTLSLPPSSVTLVRIATK